MASNDVTVALGPSGEYDYQKLKVDASGYLYVTPGASFLTQYTEGDTDASITGTALMMEGAGNSLVPAQGTVANGLLVDVSRVLGTVTVSGTVSISGTPTVNLESFVSTSNVSSTPLGGGATYTGSFEEILKYAQIGVNIYSDQSGTLIVDYSADGVTTHQTETYTFTVDSPGTPQGRFLGVMREIKYFRVRYTNGATAQGVFNLSCILSTIPSISEVHEIQRAITATTDAIVTKGVIYGLTTGGGGGYVAVKVTPSGALTAAVTQDTSPWVVSGTVAATQSGTWNINNVSGTVSLPTGAATSANQSTEITSLQLLDDVVVADNAAFTDGTTKVSMAGFVLDETAGTALTENDAAAARVDSKRAQVLVIEDGTTRGRRLTITSANAAKVDNSGVDQPIKQARSSFDHGRKSSIGTTAAQITTTSISAIMGVTVKAARTNSVRVFIGNSDVTADSADSTDGMELGPGESCFVPVDNANKVYVIAESGSSAKVFWVVA